MTGECGAGHESAGEIYEIGPDVTGWKVGDRVAVEAGVPCGECDFCRKGRYVRRFLPRAETDEVERVCGRCVLLYPSLPRHVDAVPRSSGAMVAPTSRYGLVRGGSATRASHRRAGRDGAQWIAAGRPAAGLVRPTPSRRLQC